MSVPAVVIAMKLPTKTLDICTQACPSGTLAVLQALLKCPAVFADNLGYGHFQPEDLLYRAEPQALGWWIGSDCLGPSLSDQLRAELRRTDQWLKVLNRNTLSPEFRQAQQEAAAANHSLRAKVAKLQSQMQLSGLDTADALHLAQRVTMLEDELQTATGDLQTSLSERDALREKLRERNNSVRQVIDDCLAHFKEMQESDSLT